MNLEKEGLILIRVKRFDNYKCTDENINAFLEANNVEYVDMRCSDNSVFLIYCDKKNMPHRKPYEKYPENKKGD